MLEYILSPDVANAVHESVKHAIELSQTPEARGAKSLLKTLWNEHRQRLQRADRQRMVNVLAETLEAVQDIDARVSAIECKERGAERLVQAALEAADESPSELKQRLLGRAIAARLGAPEMTPPILDSYAVCLA
jgi:hypothetical protein